MFLRKSVVFLFFSFLFLGLFSLTSCSNKDEDIISTVYAGYDFANAVLGKDSNHNATMLVKPGVEIHDFQPSAANIKSILNAKVFIYVGGEDDAPWVEEEILTKVSSKTKVINMFECLKNKGVNLLDEEKPTSALEEEEEEEEEEEYDAHVWTSPKNAIIITEAIRDALCEIDSNNKDTYINNTKKYVDSLNEIDNSIRNIVANSKNNLMIFGDRFPLLYFVKEYGINYDAAFNGCSSNHDASSQVIVSLTNKVIENKLKYVFIIEMSSSSVARTIKDEVSKKIKNGEYDGNNVEILTFYSMQNITKDDFNKGYTYIDFMNMNIEALKLALN